MKVPSAASTATCSARRATLSARRYRTSAGRSRWASSTATRECPAAGRRGARQSAWIHLRLSSASTGRSRVRSTCQRWTMRPVRRSGAAGGQQGQQQHGQGAGAEDLHRLRAERLARDLGGPDDVVAVLEGGSGHVEVDLGRVEAVQHLLVLHAGLAHPLVLVDGDAQWHGRARGAPRQMARLRRTVRAGSAPSPRRTPRAACLSSWRSAVACGDSRSIASMSWRRLTTAG